MTFWQVVSAIGTVVAVLAILSGVWILVLEAAEK